jgi:hypothetical protein
MQSARRSRSGRLTPGRRIATGARGGAPVPVRLSEDSVRVRSAGHIEYTGRHGTALFSGGLGQCASGSVRGKPK